MKQLLAVVAALLLLVNLAALEIEAQGHKAVTWQITELRELPLEEFETTRVKGIETVTDTWKGIALLGWLDQQQDCFWHELEFISVDGHKLRLHRADLEPKPVWLALSDSKGWLEEGIRLVFPGQRDNIWIRGLDRIVLHGFTSLPAPRRIYSWEDIRLPQDESGIINLADLMSGFFAESQGELLIVSQHLKPVVLKYPEHLSSAQIVTSEGLLFLKSASLPASLLPNPLIYLQMGHQAIILPQALELLPELGILLSWPEPLQWQTVKPIYNPYSPGVKLPQGSWLERN